MNNKFPRWKYALLIVTVIIGLIYSLPNIYGEDPAVQITGLGSATVDSNLQSKINNLLEEHQYAFKPISMDGNNLLIRFLHIQHQLEAQEIIKNNLGNNYSVALNLAPVTPPWLDFFGAKPMKLGLDLRGGVRFLMDIDVAANLSRHIETDFAEIKSQLRNRKIQYTNFKPEESQASLSISLASDAYKQAAMQMLSGFDFQQYNVAVSNIDNLSIDVTYKANHLRDIKNNVIEQTVATLRNRVNELGIAEAIVQRQGANRAVVELPGIQDTARAKDILGKTATLEFVMVDSDNDVATALQTNRIPAGSRVVKDKYDRPFLLKKRVILTGESITGASSSIEQQEGKPAVKVRLGGGKISLFKDTTMKNIGKQMAVVYKETKIIDKLIDGELQKIPEVYEKVISAATIQSALGSDFQITGLAMQEARDLALLLRAGALPATISIVEEKIIGPSMGQENIEMGTISVAVGLGLVMLFMTFYYSVFGIIANIGLMMNLVLLVAIMSLLGATLTLPGIAGIVLTLGMAVDANVLIFERIREEMRTGVSPLACIVRGFEHAFSTIVDANLTTLIVGLILFSIGSGPIKGFAVTLSIGIVTSMFTAITGTRAMISCLYNGKENKRLMVGV